MPLPEMNPVTSSNIKAVGHHAPEGEDPVLYIHFSNGTIYKYPNVPREAFDALLAADSVGKHFYANIRKNFIGVKHDEAG